MLKRYELATLGTARLASPCQCRVVEEPIRDERRRNLVVPRYIDRNTTSPATVVGHPMGAVKEQSANLYAAKIAERGFVTMRWTCRSGVPATASRATRSHRDDLVIETFVDAEQLPDPRDSQRTAPFGLDGACPGWLARCASARSTAVSSALVVRRRSAGGARRD